MPLEVLVEVVCGDMRERVWTYLFRSAREKL